MTDFGSSDVSVFLGYAPTRITNWMIAQSRVFFSDIQQLKAHTCAFIAPLEESILLDMSPFKKRASHSRLSHRLELQTPSKKSRVRQLTLTRRSLVSLCTTRRFRLRAWILTRHRHYHNELRYRLIHLHLILLLPHILSPLLLLIMGRIPRPRQHPKPTPNNQILFNPHPISKPMILSPLNHKVAHRQIFKIPKTFKILHQPCLQNKFKIFIL